MVFMTEIILRNGIRSSVSSDGDSELVETSV